MKRVLNLILLVVIAFVAKSQQPVKWNWSVKKITDKQYEIYLTASIDHGWHIYSQKQPKEAIASPTTIVFSKNPLIALKGKILEKGNLMKIKEEVLGTESWMYENEISFVQRVELKGNVKTNINGSVEFQVCTNEKCLPPATVAFSLAVKE